MPGDPNQTAIEALQAMSPARRAAQLFAATIANAGNSATFGGVGAIGDLFRGTDWGTTGGQLSAQVRAASPVADTASRVIGAVGSGKALLAAAPAAVGGVRAALTAAPTIGTRAAALGATSPSYAGTLAKILGPAAAVLGIAGYANAADSPAAPVVAEPLTPKDAVASALAQGRAAPKDPQADLSAAISSILGGKHTISDVQAVGPLVPAAIKPGGSMKDMIFGQAYAQSKAIADQSVSEIQAQAAAGTITADERDKAITKILKTHFDQTAGLVGYDPSKVPLINPDATE